MDPGQLAIVAAVIAATAVATPGQVAGDEYAVWTDQLNMRAAPTTGAKVLAVLERGARVRDRGAEIRSADEQEWREVTAAGGKAGWVANHYIIPAAVYDDFAGAEAFARAGEAAKMAKEIAAVNARRGRHSAIIASPDGRHVIFEVAGMGQAWSDKYLFGPVLHFAADKGMVDYLGASRWAEGIWSADSRWVVVGGGPDYSGPLSTYDAETYNFSDLGAVKNGGYEFYGGYLIWYQLDTKSEPRPSEIKSDLLPTLVATDLAHNKTIILLQPDFSTLRPVPKRSYYEVQLIPAADVPSSLKQAPLYKESLNQFVPVYETAA